MVKYVATNTPSRQAVLPKSGHPSFLRPRPPLLARLHASVAHHRRLTPRHPRLLLWRGSGRGSAGVVVGAPLIASWPLRRCRRGRAVFGFDGQLEAHPAHARGSGGRDVVLCRDAVPVDLAGGVSARVRGRGSRVRVKEDLGYVDLREDRVQETFGLHGVDAGRHCSCLWPEKESWACS